MAVNPGPRTRDGWSQRGSLGPWFSHPARLTVAGEYGPRTPKLSPENHSTHVRNDVSNDFERILQPDDADDPGRTGGLVYLPCLRR